MVILSPLKVTNILFPFYKLSLTAPYEMYREQYGEYWMVNH